MADYDLNLLLARLVAMQKESLNTLTGGKIDAQPFWPWHQEALPYWWNRYNGLAIRTDISSELDVDVYTFEMGLVVAHLTEGYKGEGYDRIGDYIGTVLTYFDNHRDLNTDAGDYTSPMPHIFDEEGGAAITGIPAGTRSISNAGIPVTQLYLGFILEVPLLREVY